MGRQYGPLFFSFSYILILQVKPPGSDNFVDEVRNPYDVQCRGFIIATPVFSYLTPNTFCENFSENVLCCE